MKKICIAIHGLAHAGAERVAASWANYLARHGNDVEILVYAPCEDTYDLDERVKILPIASNREDYFRMPKIKQLSDMRRILCREKPQVLISFLPKMQINMMFATLGMHLKRIETVRNNPWVDTDVGKKRFLWNLCFWRSDKIIVQTKEQSLYFPQSLQEKCVVISNPISPEFLGNKKEYTGRETQRFVAAARLSQQKNYPLMIRAFARAAAGHPDCTLDIYGKGSPEAVAETEDLIRQLGMEGRICLRGWMQNISEELTKYDAFLMSSNYEGMPNALAEAMATGLVCLSTDCKTGPKDMIDPGVTGFLAVTGDEQSFAEGIEAILSQPLPERRTMGNAAREKILTMCGEENTLAVLNQLIESQL